MAWMLVALVIEAGTYFCAICEGRPDILLNEDVLEDILSAVLVSGLVDRLDSFCTETLAWPLFDEIEKYPVEMAMPSPS
ncbi:hypothetical protein A0H81_12715 [Grifola frondosa]|uniref:Uncharacterized protein n=1 Tax=Grifola frondosa TaxID=5627 RepID=A0A1C7LTI0_GRIFR|nr:hypothetical protein A0H81_12715 [Grifola frondosa]